MTHSACSCPSGGHANRRIVLTGGPGAGKTAILEVVRRRFCEHVDILPESASILFSGGFPRRMTDAGGRAAQRAIFHVQRELELLSASEPTIAVTLCDRGTVDGLAYWPGDSEGLWRDVGTTHALELARYAAVIHLRTPPADRYPGHNGVRTESALEAARIDERIARAWERHPNRRFVESSADFMEKVSAAIAFVEDEIPACCRGRAVQPAVS